MKITEISLNRPVTVCMFFVSLVVIGLIAGQRLPLEFFPDIEFPGLQVTIPYRNSTPEEVERRITRPAEEALATLPGIEHMNSTSKDDGAEIQIQFRVGEDMAVKGVEARDKIDAIRAQLPQDLERIQVQKFAAGSIPILTLRVSAGRDLAGAYDMLNRNLKRRIERLPGVAHVELYGVSPKQIRVELAADRVAEHGVDMRLLAEALQKANFAITAGDVIEAGKRYYVKPEGRFHSVEDVSALVIDKSGLKLGDIAEVRYAQPILTFGRHLNLRNAVGLDVFKETGSNLVDVGARVSAEIEEVKRLPEMTGISIISFQDSAHDVKESLSNLLDAGMIGALLSFVVLFAFLRDWRMTLIVTAAVPLSIIMALGAMYFLGYSINILTLMGLMLSVGMLVDNSVVVTESIFKENAAGTLDQRAATLEGVNAVGLAVTLGTLTTAIVFLPNIFGAQNEITIYLAHVAVTICLSLAASLLVAITLIPQLTSRVLTPASGGARWMARLSTWYAGFLDSTLHHRGKMGMFIIAIIASAAIPVSLVKSEFFSQNTPQKLLLQYNLNGVYPVAKVEESVNVLEAYFTAHKQELQIASVYTYFDIERAQTVLYLKDGPERTLKSDEIKERARKGMPHIAIGEPSFDEQRGGAQQKLAVQVFGEATDHLREVAQDVASLLKRVPGLTDVRVDTGASSWEVQVRVDRDRARLYGLSSQDVAQVVAGAMRGTPLKPYYAPSGEIEMVLELRREDRLDLDALRSLPLQSSTGARVPLSAVATLSIGDVPGAIKREDRRTALSINFGTAKDVTADDAKKKVGEFMGQLQLPAGYSWGFGRAFDEDEEQMMGMVINMLLALACIYLVMAALFESMLAPTAIITGILFSFIGVYWFFLATNTTFSFMAMIGMLVLMGVVVNNGIVLVDHVHQLRQQGLSRERALVQGSRDRLRPILMTAASTVLGMVPLAIGDTTIGGDGPPYYPMARAVMGGLAFATVISLIVLPTLYLMIEDLGLWGRRMLARARGQGPAPAMTVAEVAVK